MTNIPSRSAKPQSPAASESLDSLFENYFVVARNRGDGHNDVTIRREQTDRYLTLVTKDHRFGNAERNIAPHAQVYAYAAIQLVWDRARRCWTLPPQWIERLLKAGIAIPGAPTSRDREDVA